MRCTLVMDVSGLKLTVDLVGTSSVEPGGDVTVDGTTVATRHVVLAMVATGDLAGHWDEEYWLTDTFAAREGRARRGARRAGELRREDHAHVAEPQPQTVRPASSVGQRSTDRLLHHRAQVVGVGRPHRTRCRPRRRATRSTPSRTARGSECGGLELLGRERHGRAEQATEAAARLADPGERGDGDVDLRACGCRRGRCPGASRTMVPSAASSTCGIDGGAWPVRTHWSRACTALRST